MRGAVAVLLLVVSMTVTWYALRRQRQLFKSAEPEAVGWSMPAALVVLGIATVATAFVSETLVGTLQAFADTAHLSDFFVAAVIVAVLGNATEHGSAVLLIEDIVKLDVEIIQVERIVGRNVDWGSGTGRQWHK